MQEPGPFRYQALLIHKKAQKVDGVCLTSKTRPSTFTTSQGTIFYRLRHDPTTVMCVIVLLAYGCPVPAIVKAKLSNLPRVSRGDQQAENNNGDEYVGINEDEKAARQRTRQRDLVSGTLRKTFLAMGEDVR
jgi:hypothetical protein